MPDLTPPEPTFPEPPGRNPWTVWGTMALAMLHVGVLAFFLWPSPAKATSAEPPPAEQSAAPTESAAEICSPETPSETAAPETEFKASATEASEPVPETSSAEVAPIRLSRPIVRGLTAPESVPDEAVSAVTADTGEMAEGTAPPAPAPSAEPDIATL